MKLSTFFISAMALMVRVTHSQKLFEINDAPAPTTWFIENGEANIIDVTFDANGEDPTLFELFVAGQCGKDADSGLFSVGLVGSFVEFINLMPVEDIKEFCVEVDLKLVGSGLIADKKQFKFTVTAPAAGGVATVETTTSSLVVTQGETVNQDLVVAPADRLTPTFYCGFGGATDATFDQEIWVDCYTLIPDFVLNFQIDDVRAPDGGDDLLQLNYTYGSYASFKLPLSYFATADPSVTVSVDISWWYTRRQLELSESSEAQEGTVKVPVEIPIVPLEDDIPCWVLIAASVGASVILTSGFCLMLAYYGFIGRKTKEDKKEEEVNDADSLGKVSDTKDEESDDDEGFRDESPSA